MRLCLLPLALLPCAVLLVSFENVSLEKLKHSSVSVGLDFPPFSAGVKHFLSFITPSGIRRRRWERELAIIRSSVGVFRATKSRGTLGLSRVQILRPGWRIMKEEKRNFRVISRKLAILDRDVNSKLDAIEIRVGASIDKLKSRVSGLERAASKGALQCQWPYAALLDGEKRQGWEAMISESKEKTLKVSSTTVSTLESKLKMAERVAVHLGRDIERLTSLQRSTGLSQSL